MTIYVDLDGVLADFDRDAEMILGTNNIYKYEFIHGAKKFWDKLNEFPNFFRELSKKDDADYLFYRIPNPTILTALPHTDADRVRYQKTAWVDEHFPDTPVITCLTKDKPNYCEPGDILIDDRAVNRDAWIAKGGIYIIHTSAANTITTLRALGVIE